MVKSYPVRKAGVAKTFNGYLARPPRTNRHTLWLLWVHQEALISPLFVTLSAIRWSALLYSVDKFREQLRVFGNNHPINGNDIFSR